MLPKCKYLKLINVFVLIMTTAAAIRPPASDFHNHELVQPLVLHGITKREILSTKDPSGVHHPHVVMKLPVDGEGLELDLLLNHNLVTDNYVLSYQQGGKTTVLKPKKEDLELCQYSGSIRGVPGSWAALSTCHGVRGLIFDGQQMNYIQPADDDIQSQHYLYKHLDLKNQQRCGYNSGVTNHSAFDHQLLKNHIAEKNIHMSRYKRAVSEDARGPFNANKLSRYVELVLVADKAVYKANGKDLRTVHRQMKDVANIMHVIYAPLNIFIALVGVVVWTEKDEIQFELDSDAILANFLNYRKSALVKDIPNDNAILITQPITRNALLGKALVGPICTYEYSGGFANNMSEIVGLVATSAAHVLGHNLGMVHDTKDCKCPDENCMMAQNPKGLQSRNWSSCSVNSLKKAFERGMDYCLRNKPKRLFDSPTCGNGFVEQGEQCDCGPPAIPGACGSCCDPYTCLLRANASCATGECCDLQKCQPRPAGSECRAADSECDLPEYCSGSSEYCPKDVYKMDSTPCTTETKEQAYCVRGSCRSHTDQCRLLWGSTGQSSHDKCYQINTHGRRNGHCGYDRVNNVYEPCQKADVRCGSLQCQHLNEEGLQFGMESVSTLSAVFIRDNDGSILACRSAMVDLGLSDGNPGMVPDGAKCGEDMMCLQHKCVSVAEFRKTIADKPSSVCPSDCSGHGVCNSEGHCHCDIGYSPPMCNPLLFGGSFDSGPVTITPTDDKALSTARPVNEDTSETPNNFLITNFGINSNE